MADPQWLTDDKKYVAHRGAPENETPYEKNVIDALAQAHAHIDELRKMLDQSDACEEAEALLFRAEPPRTGCVGCGSREVENGELCAACEDEL